MSKLKKLVRILGVVIKKPVLLNRVLSEPDIWKEHVARRYGPDFGLRRVDPEPLIGGGGQRVCPVTFLDGGSLVTDLLLLRSLAGRYPSCRYFEIGTWRGESVANVSEVAGECYTLNLSPEQMRKRGLPEGYIKQVGCFSKGLDNVMHLQGNSADFDFSAMGKKFDLVFIDGDHHYHMVRNDTEKVFRHLLHERSIVVWHDYTNHPEPVRPGVLAGILDGTPERFHHMLVHVAHTRCAVYFPEEIHKELPGEEADKKPPGHYFDLQVNMKKTGKG